MKSAAFLLLLVACSTQGGSSTAPTGYACDEGHACPDQAPCLKVGALYCCGGIACKADFFSCSTSTECGADRKCEGGGCVQCATAGCQEVGDGGGIRTDLGNPNSGCADGRGEPVYPGDPNGERQWKCPTLIAAGEIGRKCAAGYELCAAPLYSGAGSELCKDAAGFFASAVISTAPSAPPPDAQTVCGRWTGAPVTSQRFIHGCGNAGGVYDFPTQPCQGFRHAVNCKNGALGDPAASFSCPAVSGDIDLEQVTNTDPNSGVTCCKK